LSDINNIFKQLKKRKVFRSLAIYAGASFIILQVCSIVFPALLLPEWTMRLVVILLIIGFPILILFSWIYDVTPEGIIKTDKGKSSTNINYSTILLLLVIMGGVLFYFQDRFFKPKVNPKSIAVLPFDNFSPNPEDEYLSSGFTEVIIANLAKVKDLMVISRTSVMRYKNTDMSLKDIAKELNVANILEGSIQRTDRKIRVVGQLIEAKTDKHLWAETYDAEFEDIFSIQTSIATEIASALKSQITESERLVIEDKKTDNIEAYEMYLKVKELRREELYTSAKIRKELLKKIIGIDPQFAEAYALIALEYSEAVHYGFSENFERSQEKAKEMIDKAFELKPDSPEIRFAYGYYYYGCHKDFLQALKHYEYALKQEPGNADYNAYIGFAYRRLGDGDKTIKFLENALELNPNVTQLYYEMVGTYTFFRKYEKIDLIKHYERLYKLIPDQGSLYQRSAYQAFWLDGNTKNARKIIEKGKELVSNFSFITFGMDVYDKKYEEYLDLVSDVEGIDYLGHFIMPSDVYRAYAYWLLEDNVNMVNFAKKALNTMQSLEGYEEDPRYHSMLGMIYAMLGENDIAIKEAKMAIPLSSKDHYKVSLFESQLAEVYVVLGENDKALDIIENLLSKPSRSSWVSIKYHHVFDKIFRNNPRFKSIVKKDEDRFRREATYDTAIYFQ